MKSWVKMHTQFLLFLLAYKILTCIQIRTKKGYELIYMSKKKMIKKSMKPLSF
jgi:hypothetical protein